MKKEIWLAPMVGITDTLFRSLVCKFGASGVVSEMISSEAITRGSKKTYKKLSGNNSCIKNIIQISGCNPIVMAESAKINVALGAEAIDINMGCPSKKVINGNAGAYLMKDEDLAVSIASAVLNAVDVPVSVKMRLGWDDKSKNVLSLSKKFEKIGIASLAIHGRTRAQAYSGNADYTEIKKVREAVSIPVICNGDINDIESAEKAFELSGCNSIMIGRGALGRPWLLSQLLCYFNDNEKKDILDVGAQLKVVLEHFHENIELYGAEAGIKMFRKHFYWYSRGMRASSEFRSKVNSLENEEEILETVRLFYSLQ